MPASVYLGPLLAKPPLRMKEGSLLMRWLSLVSCIQLCAFLVDILAWVMCIATTASVSWRVWHVENINGIGSGNVWIGIWAVCFWRDPYNDGDSFWHCEELNEQHPTLPREIFIAQDLMALASIMSSAALGIISFALFNVLKPKKHKDFVLTFFRLGSFMNIPAGILVLISVIWNMSAVLQNKEINFPDNFGLPEIPSHQHIGLAIYLGYITAGLQLLSAAYVMIEGCCIRTTSTNTYLIEAVVVITTGSAVKSESLTTCSNCGSLLDLVIQEKSSAVEMEESHSEDLFIREESSPVEMDESHAPQSSPEVPKHTIIHVTPCNREQ